ncbi:endonuclease domain-containing protein [Shewanella xiamenensis]|uniref:endonuclease domain-containing protein n=1 Tax=Shewanella xiamenensis TaxID=332186 RepID=UPI0021BEA16B|nr:endonuclease domain-containing protein [Shewanella xiamenensis]MCT8876637.1 hypothetical protein [Shewanella xiamenensis]
MSRILKQKELKELRMNSECFMCGSTDDLVVDHDHNTHHIRHILCRTCNGSYLLGGIENRLHTLATRAGISLADAIIMIQEYLTEDYSANDYYPNMISVECKRFARLSASDQRQKLLSLGVGASIVHELSNGRLRQTAFKAALKEVLCKK